MAAAIKSSAVQGAFFGLTAAILFGSSVPLAKVLLGQIQPFLLAGLFYFGAGLGLSIWIFIKGLIGVDGGRQQAPLTKTDLPWLAGAIFFGGIAAELLLLLGLQTTSASAASLLLNLETVFTALVAWLCFKEHSHARIACGIALICLGSITLGLNSDWQFTFTTNSLFLIAAALSWGIDNNLTRRISHGDPVQITALKGTVAGLVNISIGIATGAQLPPAPVVAASLLIGLLSYGVSLVFFIFGLRYIGAARTSGYFSLAPFVGAAAAIIFLHDQITMSFCLAALLMTIGLWLQLSEKHEHEHTHAYQLHSHKHYHDEHHQHTHKADDPPGEPHTHLHEHDLLIHSHQHYPDIHHRHQH